MPIHAVSLRSGRAVRVGVIGLLSLTVALPSPAATASVASPRPAGEVGVRPSAAAPSAAPSSVGAASAYTPAVVPKAPRVIARNLDAPWGLAVLPDGNALVAERDTGRIRRLNGKGNARVLGRVPGVDNAGEGGLLGLAVSPNFRANRWVYAYVTSARDNRIVRMRLRQGNLGRPRVVLAGIPKSFTHNGGRLLFGPDGMLYASTGDAGVPARAQRWKSLAGKILRIRPGGAVPADNPRPGRYAFSRGHRNVQGLAFDSKGRLFASEFGQDTWDELNLIRGGRNYGWPLVEGRARRSGLVDPIAQWRPAQASPSGIAIVADTVFMATLRGTRLWRIRLGPPRSDGQPRTRDRHFFNGTYGRLRTVVAHPDGSLWLVTNNTDGRGSPGRSDDRVVRFKLR